MYCLFVMVCSTNKIEIYWKTFSFPHPLLKFLLWPLNQQSHKHWKSIRLMSLKCIIYMFVVGSPVRFEPVMYKTFYIRIFYTISITYSLNGLKSISCYKSCYCRRNDFFINYLVGFFHCYYWNQFVEYKTL